MRQTRSPADFLELPNAKARVFACLSALLVLVLVSGARCGKPHGQFRHVQSTAAVMKEPWGWWMEPSELRGPEPPMYVFEPYDQELLGPPNRCVVRNAGATSDDDIMIAYQYWMGVGYSIADFIARRNGVATYETYGNPQSRPNGFPMRDCTPGRLSKNSLAEFYRVLEQTQLCEDPPRPTWENMGIDQLCVRKGDEVCMIGIGDTNDPRQRLLKMTVARLAIYGCASKPRLLPGQELN